MQVQVSNWTFEARVWSGLLGDLATGCWVWQRAQVSGYGVVTEGSRLLRVHRVVYEWLVGPIPPGMVLHHLCGTKACARPNHLAPLSRAAHALADNPLILRNLSVNACPAGHPYDLFNTKQTRRGRRDCLECKRLEYAHNRATYQAWDRARRARDPEAYRAYERARYAARAEIRREQARQYRLRKKHQATMLLSDA